MTFNKKLHRIAKFVGKLCGDGCSFRNFLFSLMQHGVHGERFSTEHIRFIYFTVYL